MVCVLIRNRLIEAILMSKLNISLLYRQTFPKWFSFISWPGAIFIPYPCLEKQKKKQKQKKKTPWSERCSSHWSPTHYENTPIQICRKFHLQKLEKFQIKTSHIFHIFARKHRLWYSLEPPRRDGSNEYPQCMFTSKIKKNNVYSCKPQFYDIKVGFKGVKIT